MVNVDMTSTQSNVENKRLNILKQAQVDLAAANFRRHRYEERLKEAKYVLSLATEQSDPKQHDSSMKLDPEVAAYLTRKIDKDPSYVIALKFGLVESEKKQKEAEAAYNTAYKWYTSNGATPPPRNDLGRDHFFSLFEALWKQYYGKYLKALLYMADADSRRENHKRAQLQLSQLESQRESLARNWNSAQGKAGYVEQCKRISSIRIAVSEAEGKIERLEIQCKEAATLREQLSTVRSHMSLESRDAVRECEWLALGQFMKEFESMRL